MRRVNANIFTYTWDVFDDETITHQSYVRCFGVTSSDQSVYVRIAFPVSCYVDLAPFADRLRAETAAAAGGGPGTGRLAREIMGELLRVVRKDAFVAAECRVVWRRRLYYYDDKTHPFALVKFKLRKMANIFKASLRRKGVRLRSEGRTYALEVHENNARISELLKFYSEMNVDPCGWLNVNGYLVERAERESRCDFEIRCAHTQVRRVDGRPAKNITVLVFDIEAYSSNHNAMPQSHRPSDKVYQISGVLVQPDGSASKHLFSLGRPDRARLPADCELELLGTEADLLRRFAQFVNERGVCAIAGYNTLGWDFRYMIERSKLNKCFSAFCDMGKIVGCCGVVPANYERFEKGAFFNMYPDAKGVLMIDVLPLVRRRFALKNYKLATAVAHFGLSSKIDLPAREMFRLYERGTPAALGRIAEYCMHDSVITHMLYEEIKVWIDGVELTAVSRVPFEWLNGNCTQKQIYSQVLDFCRKNNYVLENKEMYACTNSDYVGATVLPPAPGFYRNVLCFDFASLYPTIMMAYNIDYATLVREPAGALLVGRHDPLETIERWARFPCYVKLLVDVFRYGAPRVEEVRAAVLAAVEGARRDGDYVVVGTAADLQRLAFAARRAGCAIGIYPTRSGVRDADCHVFAWEDHSNCEHDADRPRLKDGSFSKAKCKVHCATNYARFVRKDRQAGVIPTILENLIGARKATRAQIKAKSKLIAGHVRFLVDRGETAAVRRIAAIDPKLADREALAAAEPVPFDGTADACVEFVRAAHTHTSVLDKRQLSYKVCANSMYGAMGADYSRALLPLVDGARSITYRGRAGIAFLRDFVRENYAAEGAAPVYGDTDSIMVQFAGVDSDAGLRALAERVIADTQRIFPPPMLLEFEKRYNRFLIFSKKRYIAQVANVHGQVVETVNKGNILKRRDNSGMAKRIYASVVDYLFERVPDTYKDLHLAFRARLAAALAAEASPAHEQDQDQGDEDAAASGRGSSFLFCESNEKEKKKALVKRRTPRSAIVAAEARRDPAGARAVAAVDELLTMVSETITSIFQLAFALDSFVLVKSFAGKYKSDTLPAHAYVAQTLIARGFDIAQGERIEYVLTNKLEGVRGISQGMMSSDVETFRRHADVLRVNYLYYVEKQFIKPVDELIKVSVGVEDYVKRDYRVRAAKARVLDELRGLSNPVTLVE